MKHFTNRFSLALFLIWAQVVFLGPGANIQDASQIPAYKLDIPSSAPLPRGLSISLTRAETARLWPGLHLNDAVIDLFMAKLFYCELKLPKVHVFSSYFYSALNVNQRKVDPSCFYHWTKSLDIFSLDYIVLPINEVTHWSVAIVCNPGLLRPGAPDSGDDPTAKAPVIVKMDSTKGHKTQRVSLALRAWLSAEWNLRNGLISLPTTLSKISSLASEPEKRLVLSESPVLQGIGRLFLSLSPSR